MNKRSIAKFAVRTLVAIQARTAIQSTLESTVPATQKAKISEAAGIVGGYVVSEQAGPTTDMLVDAYFDRRESKKKTR